MNIALWIMQVLMAATFLYSGVCKSLWSERKLVTHGQTGVEHLNPYFIKFIGVAEILGSVALIVPMLFNVATCLTPVAAFCLASIMPFAASIHYKRKEYKNVATNIFILCVCIFIGFERLSFN